MRSRGQGTAKLPELLGFAEINSSSGFDLQIRLSMIIPSDLIDEVLSNRNHVKVRPQDRLNMIKL